MLSTFASGAMFGERTGDGIVRLVALHGWCRSHDDLDKVVAGFDAIALDLPGFGASSPPPGPWGAELYGHEVAKVLHDIGEPVVLFGHSFGGRIAVTVAANYPHLVKALVLTGAPLIRRPSTRKAPFVFRLAKKLNGMGLVSNELMETQRKKYGSADYRAATGTMREVFVKVVNESYEQFLGRIQCPVELVWGEHDTEASLGQAREAAALLTASNVVVVPNGTHWLPNEDPEPLREAIRRHIG